MKTRFAPSPTGFLHIGGLRTALFSYLVAKRAGGKFALRIEDTDQERYVEGAVESIINSLEWAGLVIDEGVVLKKSKVEEIGKFGPYVQSKRLDIYQKHVQELINKNFAYYCFCTKVRLDELRAIQELNKTPTGYDGHCQTLSVTDVENNLKTGVSYVIRMKMPETGYTIINDLIRGEVKFENKLIDDQVLLKSDGFPTYHLAVVVDDHYMEITHVVRGEEWISSTPKHVAIYNAFGWDLPQYAHLALIVNEQKQKLSKRHGDVSVEDFREKGYLAEALVNFITFLGWNPGDDREIFSLEELEREFSLAKVSKSAAVFNREKLDWYGKQYIAKLTPAELAKRAKPFFNNANLKVEDKFLEKVVTLEQGRAATLVQIAESSAYLFAEELSYEAELLIWKKSDGEETKLLLNAVKEFLSKVGESDWSKDKLEPSALAWIKDNNWQNGPVLWPLRVALSGQKNSPGPFEIAAVLGKEKTLARVSKALKLLQTL